MRILIVDDSRAIQIIVKRSLEKVGFSDLQIKLAVSGIEALEILKTWKPDLLLTDWHMPEMSGIDLMSEMNRQMLNINVGLITTETAATRLALAKESGAKFIINKPFDEPSLIKQVMRFLPSGSKGYSITAPSELMSSKSYNEPVETNAPIEEPEVEPKGLILPTTDDIEDIIAETFFTDVTVKLKSNEGYEAHQYPYLLGMFSPASEAQIKAICILKHSAIKQVSKMFATVHTQYREPFDNKSKEQLCDHFLRTIQSKLIQSEDNTSLILKKSNLVTKPFERIVELYKPNNKQKQDYYIQVKGYDTFVLTIISS